MTANQPPTSPWAGTRAAAALAKVPEVTLGFWVLKVLATTLGETGADWFTQQLHFGYAAGIALFCVPLVLLVAAQIRARGFNKWLYWGTIIASTTAGTALADFFDRSLGIGYPGGTLALVACVALSLAAWRRVCGTIAVASVAAPGPEAFYWLTITFSQTLGTALGDWTADSFGDATFMGVDSGYVFGALIFAGALAVLAVLWRFTGVSREKVGTGFSQKRRDHKDSSRTGLFWAAFVLTRPLGATVGDFLDKPLAQGGLNLGRDAATAALLVAIALGLALIPQRAARTAH